MKEIAILGGTEFSLGFQIAGINNLFTIDEENPDQSIKKIMEKPEIGLVIMEEKTLDLLSEEMRDSLGQSIEPVFLTISEQDSNEEMKRLIKKSIGVDLWDK